jgi:phosphoserine phosphatase RsbU/P
MLEYAGANNSLYHIVEKELIEYKADKLSIGKSALHTEITFTNHSIKIKKNDHIYIFSDGFADQIGGPNKKKFYSPPFRQILLDNLNIPMHDHVQLLDNANQEWKGSRDQIDDILVMGIKF